MCRDCQAYSTGGSRMKGIFELMLSARADSTAKRFLLYLVALFSITPLAVAGQNKATSSGSWSGILVSSACNADEAFNESPECTKNLPGAKLALYDDTNRVMYGLEPQESVAARLGETVTVRGALDGDTIQIASDRADVDRTRGGPESPGIFNSRPVRSCANSRHFERNERNRSALFPFR